VLTGGSFDVNLLLWGINVHKQIIGKTEFTFRQIEDPELLDEIFRLRFQVYCKECNFIKEEDYPTGIEKDKYDPYSLHFVAHDQEGVIGTARLVLDSELGFPLEKHCNDGLSIDKDNIPRAGIAEISRLVISKEYRRRRGDGLYYSHDYDDALGSAAPAESPIRRILPMTFGIFREIYQESKRRKISHWYALMEKSLHLLLRLHGFTFASVGEEIDFYGPVVPYLGNIAAIETNVLQKFPSIFRYFLRGLDPKHHPNIT